MRASEAIEERAQLAAELSGAYTVALLGCEAGIPGSWELSESVRRLFAQGSIPTLRVPQAAAGLVEAGAAAAVGRGLRAFSERAARKVARSPESWAPSAGIMLGLTNEPAGMPRRQLAQLGRIREDAGRIAGELSELGPAAVERAAAQVAAPAPIEAGDLGGLVLIASGAAALWAFTRDV